MWFVKLWIKGAVIMRILADDGTEFTTVEECKSYEEKQKKCE